MRILDLIYNLLKRQRDKKESEVIRLKWQRELLQKRLDDLKRQRDTDK